MTDLTDEQMNQAAHKIMGEISPILSQFPMGVALMVGAHLVEAVVLCLIHEGKTEDALSVIDKLEWDLGSLREHLQTYGQEEVTAASAQAN